jgi:hypothetical protein
MTFNGVALLWKLPFDETRPRLAGAAETPVNHESQPIRSHAPSAQRSLDLLNPSCCASFKLLFRVQDLG